MQTVYNKIAGQRLERLAGLSDGVFAIAMTLLVLDLHVPAAAALQSDGDLSQALRALLPNLIAYIMSFMTLGIFWVGQQTQLGSFARSDRTLLNYVAAHPAALSPPIAALGTPTIRRTKGAS
ncbi:MAG TPA: TMEM175 family protein [Thermomicrobiales bacterium]|nr:TMEM175 family protein [Thermomicrobiales bacterium]